MKGDKHGKVTIETGIFRKEAAADMYMLESSAHPLTEKRHDTRGMHTLPNAMHNEGEV